MDTLEDLGRHIEVAEDLQSVVRTMKAISAVAIRRHEAAEKAMAQYLETVELGLQVALRQVPEGAPWLGDAAEGRAGVVVIGSEIGLCGGFNENLVDFALGRLSGAGIGAEQRRVLVVGSRAEASWHAAAEAPAHLEESPATVEALAATVGRLLTRLDHWREREDVSRLLLYHQKMGGPEGSAPAELPLFPIDPGWLDDLRRRAWPSHRLPACFGPRAEVTRGLIRQLLFARLYGAIVQSHAAEHAERLTAMQAAEKNVSEKIDELRKTHQLLRQQVITAELLDIIGGYEAAASNPEDGRSAD